jgi:eukaryotic-like serine/threonine-protein kinase
VTPRIHAGGAWGASGVIVFAPKFNVPLYQVPAEGGEATPTTKLDAKEIGHRWPYFLPDGRHFLFFRYQQQVVRKPVWVGSLDSKEQKQILESESMVQYAPLGYLIYVREHALVAQRFDATTLKGGPIYKRTLI